MGIATVSESRSNSSCESSPIPEDGEEESPGAAAARELMEELGMTPDQVGLVRAGELVNDDGISKRYIYTGRVHPDMLRPSDEVHHTELLTNESIP